VTGPFFVGGTGRCGTSQLCRVLGEHPEVHSLEWESRFLVDPGGFEDLARALTTAYTPYHADDALGHPATWRSRPRPWRPGGQPAGENSLSASACPMPTPRAASIPAGSATATASSPPASSARPANACAGSPSSWATRSSVGSLAAVDHVLATERLVLRPVTVQDQAAVLSRIGMTPFAVVPGLLGPMTRYRKTR
jgi:hypothetical protein